MTIKLLAATLGQSTSPKGAVRVRLLVPRFKKVHELHGVPVHNSPDTFKRKVSLMARSKPMFDVMSSAALSLISNFADFRRSAYGAFTGGRKARLHATFARGCCSPCNHA